MLMRIKLPMKAVYIKDLPQPGPGRSGWPWTVESVSSPPDDREARLWPKISVVTPSYNQAVFLEETIRSVLLQNYPNLEYIVIDGGSRDGSVEIIRKYQHHLTLWLSEPDQGQSDAINKGFAKSTGQIFYWLNSDDVVMPGVFLKIARYWIEHPGCHWVAGDGWFVSEDCERKHYFVKGNRHRFIDLMRYHAGRYLNQPSVFFRRDIFERVQMLRTDLVYSMDLDLWLRFRTYYPLHYYPECLSYTRVHGAAKTRANLERVYEETGRVIREYMPRIHLLQKIMILFEWRINYSQSLLRKARLLQNAGERAASNRAIAQSFRIFPAQIFSVSLFAMLWRRVFPSRKAAAVL